MAVYSWIYANAKMEGNRKDYNVRVCGQELEGYRKILIFLSNRLLSTDRRLGKVERQNCWFAGYIGEERKIYLVAVGGEQETILGMALAGGGFRDQHCVLGYGFTENDIRLYRQEDGLFEPLKKRLRQIQQTGKDLESEPEQIQGHDLDMYTLQETLPELKGNYNIVQSTPTADTALWGQSLKRPVMTGIISTEDAKKLLQLFPEGLVSVVENVNLRYAVVRKAEEKKAKAKSAREKSGSSNLDRTEVETLQECKIIPSRNTNENGKNETRSNNREEGKAKAQSKSLDKKMYETIRLVDGIVDGIREGIRDRWHDLKDQEIAEERENNLAFIRKCAKFCEIRLLYRQKESIQKAVQRLDLPKGFSRQLEYYSYMQLWLCNEEKEEPITDEEEIYRMVREWAKLQKTEDNVFQKNIQYAKKIERRDERNGSI